MLCTPPAFILSQDQTLENIVYLSPSFLGAKSYFRAFVALLLLLCLSSILNLNCSSLHRTFVFALYLSLCCSIFNDRSLGFRLASRLRSRGDLVIISHCLPFVNTFFESFFNFFRFFSVPSETSFLGDSSYILSLSFYFVKTFLKVFTLLCKIMCQKPNIVGFYIIFNSVAPHSLQSAAPITVPN